MKPYYVTLCVPGAKRTYRVVHEDLKADERHGDIDLTDPLIRIDRNQEAFERLLTAAHEATHAAMPWAKEALVRQIEKNWRAIIYPIGVEEGWW